MKKVTFFLITYFISSVLLFGQSNPKIFNATDIVWAGIDFSKAKLIGSEGFTDPTAIVNDYFDKWNQLVVMESKKYNLAKAYQKDVIKNDFSKATLQNSQVSDDDLVINTSYSIDPSDIQSIVNNYKGLEGNSGIGLVYIVDYFSKLDSEGSIYVVFFDLASQEVLHMQNYKSKPKGFGLRNFWANTIYQTILDSGKDYKKALKSMK